MHILLKRKTQILAFSLAAFCTVAISTFAIKPTYKPKAHNLVNVGRERRYVPATGCRIPVISINREEQINSEIEILKDRSLIQDGVTSLDPATIQPDLDVKKMEFRLPLFLSSPDRIRRPPKKLYSCVKKSLRSREMNLPAASRGVSFN